MSAPNDSSLNSNGNAGSNGAGPTPPIVSGTLNKCPHCGEKIAINTEAKAAAYSKISMELTPAPGEMFTLDTIGGCLTNWDKLMKAVSKDLNTNCVCLVSGVTFKDNNSVNVEIIIARAGTPEYSLKQQHRRDARRSK